MAIEPTPEQIEGLAGGDLDAPVVMLNLLRFADRAQGVAEDISGMEAYQRYGVGVLPHLREVGGEVVWQGLGHQTVIGPTEERWDMIILVRYPTRKAFLDMVSKPEYQEVAKWRTAALDDSRLVAMSALATAPDPRD